MTTPNPQREKLGKAVVRWRRKLKMRSQQALADAAGIGLRSVGRIERGEYVHDETLIPIEQVFGWPDGIAAAVIHEGAEPPAVPSGEVIARPPTKPAAPVGSVEWFEALRAEVPDEDFWSVVEEWARARQVAKKRDQATKGDTDRDRPSAAG